MRHIILELSYLILEGKTESLNSCEGFKGIKGDQSGLETSRLILSNRIEVNKGEDIIDH